MLWVSLLLALSANGLGAECATRVCASRPLLQRHGFTPAPSITAQRRARPRSRSLRPRRPRHARLCPPPPAGGLLSPRVLAGAEPAWRLAGASSVPRPGEQQSSRKTLVPGTNPRTFLTETLPLAQRPFLSAPCHGPSLAETAVEEPSFFFAPRDVRRCARFPLTPVRAAAFRSLPGLRTARASLSELLLRAETCAFAARRKRRSLRPRVGRRRRGRPGPRPAARTAVPGLRRAETLHPAQALLPAHPQA